MFLRVHARFTLTPLLIHVSNIAGVRESRGTPNAILSLVAEVAGELDFEVDESYNDICTVLQYRVGVAEIPLS